MLPISAFNLADRLVNTLTTLVYALANLVTPHSTPTSPEHAARSLLRRLITLMAAVIRIENVGPRTTPEPKPTTPAKPRLRPDRTPAPRRRPGWLLAALPDIAPAIAADLAAILTDPAFAALLDAAPTLHQTLRPFLRGLGLTAIPLPPDAPPPRTSNRPRPLQTAARTAKPPQPPQPAEPKTQPPTTGLRTPNLLRNSNKQRVDRPGYLNQPDAIIVSMPVAA